MAFVLYSRAGTERLTTEASASDRCTHKLMGERSLTISFTLPEYHEIEVGDYIDFEGVRYRILESYLPEMVSTIEYKYSLTLYDDTGYLRHAKVQKPAQADIELSFSYDARPHEHIRLIVDTLNRITASSDWVVGTVIGGTSENIEYTNLFSLDALTAIAQKYKTEWWIEGRTVNLCRCEHGTPIDLAYMHGLATGLARIENSTARHFTRLYPLGSSRNIDPTKYGKSRLGLPEGRGYLERNTHLGIIEQSEEAAFAHIYPRYTGKVTAVRHEERHKDGKTFAVYYIADIAIPFDPNAHEIGGLVKHVVFQSGDLTGRDFEANYRHDTKEWELITQHPYENMSIPSGRLVPKVGDSYIPYNFRMPEEYIRRAERELETEATKWLESISEDTSVYKARTDYIDIARRSLRLRLGQRVRLSDDRYFQREGGSRLSRITSISRSLLYPTEADLEFTHTVDTGRPHLRSPRQC